MNILIIYSDTYTSSFLKNELEKSKYSISIAISESVGLKLLENEKIDVIIINQLTPKPPVEIIEKIREQLHLENPILIISSFDLKQNIIDILDAGADAYISKPIHIGELLANVRALSRRKTLSNPERILYSSDIKMNLNTKVVTRSGNNIYLTVKEFHLLKFLIENKGLVLSRVQILKCVWGINFDAGTNTVDVHINYLRKKIDKDYNTKLIQTIIGVGYLLKEI